MKRRHARSWRVVSGTLVVFSVALSGCRLQSGSPSTGERGADTSRAAIVREAQSLYDYGSERPPIATVDHEFRGPVVDDGTIPRMWIATATLKRGVTRPAHRIVARIRSTGAYPAMGIAQGDNYIWRSTWDTGRDSRATAMIVSVDSSSKPHQLLRDERKIEYSHGADPAEPRLVLMKVHSVALGACLEDRICPSGHCGYY